MIRWYIFAANLLKFLKYPKKNYGSPGGISSHHGDTEDSEKLFLIVWVIKPPAPPCLRGEYQWFEPKPSVSPW